MHLAGPVIGTLCTLPYRSMQEGFHCKFDPLQSFVSSGIQDYNHGLKGVNGQCSESHPLVSSGTIS